MGKIIALLGLFFLTGLFPCWAQEILRTDTVPSPRDSILSPKDTTISPTQPQADSVYSQVDRQPLFAGCEDELVSQSQQESCSLRKIAEFLSKNLTYPDSAKAKKTAGLVLLRFVVDENGQIGQAELLRDLGDGCGKEALRVLGLMPNFSPAIKEGKKVSCYITLPVRFRELDEKSPNQAFSLHWGATYSDKITQNEIKVLLNQPVEARDLEGNILKIKDLEISYIYKKRVKTQKVYSSKLGKAQQKLLLSAKKGGFLVLVCRVETGKNFELVEIAREFELLD